MTFDITVQNYGNHQTFRFSAGKWFKNYGGKDWSRTDAKHAAATLKTGKEKSVRLISWAEFKR